MIQIDLCFTQQGSIQCSFVCSMTANYQLFQGSSFQIAILINWNLSRSLFDPKPSSSICVSNSQISKILFCKIYEYSMGCWTINTTTIVCSNWRWKNWMDQNRKYNSCAWTTALDSKLRWKELAVFSFDCRVIHDSFTK